MNLSHAKYFRSLAPTQSSWYHVLQLPNLHVPVKRLRCPIIIYVVYEILLKVHLEDSLTHIYHYKHKEVSDFISINSYFKK